jgi:septin family protein
MGRERVSINAGRREEIRFNVMVAGESGQGKTTFVKTLYKSFCDSVMSLRNSAAESQECPEPSFIQGINGILETTSSKTLEISRMWEAVYDTGNEFIRFSVTDTPGYGTHSEHSHYVLILIVGS